MSLRDYMLVMRCRLSDVERIPPHIFSQAVESASPWFAAMLRRRFGEQQNGQ